MAGKLFIYHKQKKTPEISGVSIMTITNLTIKTEFGSFEDLIVNLFFALISVFTSKVILV